MQIGNTLPVSSGLTKGLMALVFTNTTENFPHNLYEMCFRRLSLTMARRSSYDRFYGPLFIWLDCVGNHVSDL